MTSVSCNKTSQNTTWTCKKHSTATAIFTITCNVAITTRIVKIQTKLTRHEIIHTNLPLYTLKIRAKLYEISPYFSPTYKGPVLATVFCATFLGGSQNKACLTRYNVQTPRVRHLAPSVRLYPWGRLFQHEYEVDNAGLLETLKLHFKKEENG